MRVDALRDAIQAVTEDKLGHGPIDIGAIEHRRQRVPCLMRRVLQVEVVHDWIKYCSAE